MAGRSVDLAVRIAVDAQNAGAEIEQAASGAGKFQGRMESMVGPATVALGAVAAFGAGAVSAASDVQQALGATDTVFGDNAGQVKAWSEGAASAAGLAQSSYLELANVVGAQLNNMGVAAGDATTATGGLITLGADLAATFGGSTADAVGALSSALKGEADPAEKYGLNLSAAAVAARMAADGTDKLTGEALTAAKAQTIMALATEQSGDAVGAFARESDTAEGASARASAAWTNATAALGQALLPAVTAVSTALGGLAVWVQENTTLVTVIVGVIGGLAAAVLIVVGAMKAWAVAQGVLNAVMAANPVLLVVAAIAALVAGIILLWNNCEGFRTFVLGMWEAIKGAALAAWAAISSAAAAAWAAVRGIVTSVASAIGNVISTAGNVIRSVWEAVRNTASTVWNGIKSIVAFAVGAIVSVVQGITGAITAVWDAIRSGAQAAWSAVSSAAQSVADGIVGFYRGMQSAVGAVWDAVRSAGEAVWGPIRSAAESAMSFIRGLIDGVAGAIDSVIGGLQDAMSWVSDLWGKITGAASDAAALPAGVVIGGTSAGFAGVPAGAVSPALRTPATRATGPAVGGGPTIIVQGALDPDAVARQITALLARRAARTGGPVL